MRRYNEVGYRRPPKKSQFKKGTSGNPRGRPKGSRNLVTDLKQELEEKVIVRESGRQRRLTKQQVLIKTLMAKALHGDLKAVAVIWNMMMRFDLSAQGEMENSRNAGAKERFIAEIQAIGQRLQADEQLSSPKE